MGIRKRILLSFLALFVVVLTATAIVSALLLAGSVEDRLTRQTEQVAKLFREQPDFVRPEVLDWIRRAYEAESVAVEPAGSVPSGEGVFRHPVGLGFELVMTYSSEFLSAEKARAVTPFAIVAIAGVALVLILGTFTAQAIARPIEELSKQARSLPAGDVRPVGGGAELDHLVDALNRMLEEVRRAVKLAVMGEMAASVAHEIRNPLSSMKLTVQMLREGAKDAEPYDRMLREIERLELTAAELSGTSQPLRRERVKLDAVVGDVLELMRLRLEHLSVRVETKFEPAPEVDVDVARFKSCVMNLVLNGAQAMPEGGPLKLEIAGGNGKVRFAVTDAGKGVSEAVRGRVFDPFVTTKQDGVGMGLALTRRIVEEHGGKIGFDAAERGTTFWIELDGIESSGH